MNAILLTMALSQPLPLPPGADPLPPGTVEIKESPIAAAAKLGKPLVVYVGIESKPVSGATVIRDDGHGRPGVYVYQPDGKGWLGTGSRFAVDVDHDAILQAVQPKARQPLAIPFEKVPAPNAVREDQVGSPVGDDDGPWLSKYETAKIRAAWPKNVPWGKNLKFYSLPRLYQSMYTMNNGRSKFTVPTELHDHSATLKISGGMDRVHGAWRSVKGLDVPDGKPIKVWREETDVSAFSLVPRWRWRFSEGTVAHDVLFNNAGDIFEVRTQTRLDDDWQTKTYKNLAAEPVGYAGAGASCASCHNQAALVVSVPGQIYRHAVWGDDKRFSWRPFKADGTIDNRWPISVTAGVLPAASPQYDAEYSPNYSMQMPAGRGRTTRRR